jgi:hypothetical protein
LDEPFEVFSGFTGVVGHSDLVVDEPFDGLAGDRVVEELFGGCGDAEFGGVVGLGGLDVEEPGEGADEEVGFVCLDMSLVCIMEA